MLVANSKYYYGIDYLKDVNVTLPELVNVYVIIQLPWIFLSGSVFMCPLGIYYQKQTCDIAKQFVDK